MLPETTKQRIEQAAEIHYPIPDKRIGLDIYNEYDLKEAEHTAFIVGATAEVLLNQKEIETLKAWKESASAELGKIQDWGHGNKTIPLGFSITDEAVKRLKAYDELREKAQRLVEDAERWKRAYEELEKKYKSDQEAWELINEAYQYLKIGFESAEKMADALEKIIEWVNDTGMKNVAIDDKKGMALYHSKHLALNALQQWRGEK